MTEKNSSSLPTDTYNTSHHRSELPQMQILNSHDCVIVDHVRGENGTTSPETSALLRAVCYLLLYGLFDVTTPFALSSLIYLRLSFNFYYRVLDAPFISIRQKSMYVIILMHRIVYQVLPLLSCLLTRNYISPGGNSYMWRVVSWPQ